MFPITTYARPANLEEAVLLLQHPIIAGTPNPQILAGGTDLLVKLRKELQPASYIDISGIPELREETLNPEGTLRLGAARTFREIVESPLVLSHVPLLSTAANTVAGPQIRNMGTLGGNICNGAVSADMVAPLLVMQANLCLFGPKGWRKTPLNGFHTGPGRVALLAGEILVAVEIEAAAYRNARAAYQKYAMRAAMDIATVGCAAAVKLRHPAELNQAEHQEYLGQVGQEPVIENLSLAFIVAAPTPVRCPHAEEVAKGLSFTAQNLTRIADAALLDVNPRSSWRAEKDFRLHIIHTLVSRVLCQATGISL